MLCKVNLHKVSPVVVMVTIGDMYLTQLIMIHQTYIFVNMQIRISN